MTIDISKKFIKGLNDVNQDIKTVFDNYYVFPDGLIVSDTNNYAYNVGTHLGSIDRSYIDQISTSGILQLNSTKIYKTIKDYKKYIASIDIRDNLIYLIGNGVSENIGEVIVPGSIKDKTIQDVYIQSKLRFAECYKEYQEIRISSEDVESLVKNEYRVISVEKYSTRVTRGLVPGLKRTHDLKIWFSDSEDKRLYNMCMFTKRSTTVTYHMYKCIFTK